PDFSRRQLEIVGVPTEPVAVGTELTLTVNEVDLTSLGTPVSTEVQLRQGDTLLGTFPVTDNSATISIDAQLPEGRAHYEIRTPSGTRISFQIPVAVESDRIAGEDRFATAVELSQSAYPNGADVVYVASGENWPDALAAGPAAAHEGGPLLLVRKWEAAQIVLDEIERLGAERVVIVGGQPTISGATQAQIDALATVTTVERLAGADRYETARLIADYAFESATGAYVATGNDFVDGLSAGAAAGHLDWPLLLVDPYRKVPAATIGSLDALGVDLVRVTGATATIPSARAGELVDAGFTVSRQGGADRFATSAIITAAAFEEPAGSAYLASGYNYPDALAGAAVAGAQDVPLLISTSECVPRSVHNELERQQVSRVTLIGGEPTLNADVAAFAICL
ncbi:MAG: cell wall-binding repeat-containing protein, partial [Agrococcus sp.]